MEELSAGTGNSGANAPPKRRLKRQTSMPGRFTVPMELDDSSSSKQNRPGSFRKSNSGQALKSKGYGIGPEGSPSSEKIAQRSMLSRRTMHRISSLENSTKDSKGSNPSSPALRKLPQKSSRGNGERKSSRRNSPGSGSDRFSTRSCNTSVTSLMTLTDSGNFGAAGFQGLEVSSRRSSRSTTSSPPSERDTESPRPMHGRRDSLELIIPLNTLSDIDKHLDLDSDSSTPSSVRSRRKHRLGTSVCSSRSPSPGVGSSSESSNCSPRKRDRGACSPSKTTMGDPTVAAKQRQRVRNNSIGSTNSTKAQQQASYLTPIQISSMSSPLRSRSSVSTQSIPVEHEHSPLNTDKSKIQFLFRPPSTSRIFDNDHCESMDSQEELRLANLRSEQTINLTAYGDPSARRQQHNNYGCGSMVNTELAVAALPISSLDASSSSSTGMLAIPSAANGAAIPEVDIPVVNLTLKPNVKSILKMILVGNAGVGKSCLLQRYFNGEFINDMKSTTGVQIYLRNLMMSGAEYACKIWDTAGSENAHIITQAYYKNAHAFGLVFDVTDRASFEAIPSWLEMINTHGQPNARIVLVGNKNDGDNISQSSEDALAARNERVVSKEEAKKCVLTNNLSAYIETSAQDGVHVTELVELLAQEANERMRSLTSSPAESVSDYSVSLASADGELSGIISADIAGSIIFKPERRSWKTMDSRFPRAPSLENSLNSDGSGSVVASLLRRDSFGIAMVAAGQDLDDDDEEKSINMPPAMREFLAARRTQKQQLPLNRFVLSPEARKGSNESFDLLSDYSPQSSPKLPDSQRGSPAFTFNFGEGTLPPPDSSSARNSKELLRRKISAEAVQELEEENDLGESSPPFAQNELGLRSSTEHHFAADVRHSSIKSTDPVTSNSSKNPAIHVLVEEDELDGYGTPQTTAESSRSNESSRSCHNRSGDISSSPLGDPTRGSKNINVTAGRVLRRSKSDISPRCRAGYDKDFQSLFPETVLEQSLRDHEEVKVSTTRDSSCALTRMSDSSSLDAETDAVIVDSSEERAHCAQNTNGLDNVGCFGCGFFLLFRGMRR